MQLTPTDWINLLSSSHSPGSECVIIVVPGFPRVLRIKKDDWRSHFSEFGGIKFVRGKEIEVVAAQEGGSRVAIPDWVRERLALKQCDALCITQRGERHFLKRLDLVERHAEVPGCTVIDRFERDRVERTYWNQTELGSITYEGVDDLLPKMPRFFNDPVTPFESLNGRLGLLGRKLFLGGWTESDRSSPAAYRAEICKHQKPNGSWEDSAVRTSFKLIRLLEVEARMNEAAVERAASWLLRAREPSGFPGLFMTSEAAVESFNAWKAKQEPGSKKRRNRRPTAAEYQMYLDNRDILGISNTCYGCELKVTWASAVAVEALLRCGLQKEPRVVSAVNTLLAMRQERSARWCGCGNFVADVDYPASSAAIDFSRHPVQMRNPRSGTTGMTDWLMERDDILRLACNGGYRALDLGGNQALLARTARQCSGDCSMVVHRALSYHPGYHGSSLETMAAVEYAYRQSWLGDWTGNYVSFFFSLLSRTRCPLSAFLVLRTIPLLVRRQRSDGLWQEEPIPYIGGGNRMVPALDKEETTFMILSALKTFGFLDPLRPAEG